MKLSILNFVSKARLGKEEKESLDYAILAGQVAVSAAATVALNVGIVAAAILLKNKITGESGPDIGIVTSVVDAVVTPMGE